MNTTVLVILILLAAVGIFAFGVILGIIMQWYQEWKDNRSEFDD